MTYNPANKTDHFDGLLRAHRLYDMQPKPPVMPVTPQLEAVACSTIIIHGVVYQTCYAFVDMKTEWEPQIKGQPKWVCPVGCCSR